MIKRKHSLRDSLFNYLLKTKILSNKTFVKNITNKVIAFGITPYSLNENIKKNNLDDTTEEIVFQNWLIQNPVFKKFLKEQKLTEKEFYGILSDNNITSTILELSNTALKQERLFPVELPVKEEALKNTQVFPFIHQLIEYRLNSCFDKSKHSLIVVPSSDDCIKFQDGFILNDPTVIDIVKLPNTDLNASGSILITKLLVFEGILQLAFGTNERKLSKKEYSLILGTIESIKDKKIDIQKTILLFKKSNMYLREDEQYFYFKNIDIEMDVKELVQNNEGIVDFIQDLPKNQMLYMCTSVEGIDTGIPFIIEGELVMPELLVQLG